MRLDVVGLLVPQPAVLVFSLDFGAFRLVSNLGMSDTEIGGPRLHATELFPDDVICNIAPSGTDNIP